MAGWYQQSNYIHIKNINASIQIIGYEKYNQINFLHHCQHNIFHFFPCLTQFIFSFLCPQFSWSFSLCWPFSPSIYLRTCFFISRSVYAFLYSPFLSLCHSFPPHPVTFSHSLPSSLSLYILGCHSLFHCSSLSFSPHLHLSIKLSLSNRPAFFLLLLSLSSLTLRKGKACFYGALHISTELQTRSTQLAGCCWCCIFFWLCCSFVSHAILGYKLTVWQNKTTALR